MSLAVDVPRLVMVNVFLAFDVPFITKACHDAGQARDDLVPADLQPRQQHPVREAEEGRGQEDEGRQGEGAGDAVRPV